MKKFFVVLFLVLTVGALAYFYFFKDELGDFSTWDLVPEQSSLVIESDNLAEAWETFLTSQAGQGFRKTRLFNNTDSFFDVIDSLSEDLSTRLLSEKILISVVPTAQDEYNVLYLVPLSNKQLEASAADVLEALMENPNLDFTSRVYQGQKIQEFSGRENVSFFQYKNVLIASKSAYVVEMIVRMINDGYSGNFRELNRELFELPSLESGNARVYVNFKQFSRLLQVFVDAKHRKFFEPLEEKKGGAFLDLNFNDESLVLNGFSLSYDSLHLFSTLKLKDPGELTVLNYVPKNTQYIYTINAQNEKGLFDNEEEIKWLGDEITYLQLPSVKDDETNEVIFAYSRDPGSALNYYNLKAQEAAGEDTVYRESYAGYPITEITAPYWPKQLFPQMYDAFEPAFFTMINNYIVLSNGVEALKMVIENIENENTWGKSVEMRKYLALGLEESNASLIIHPENFWYQMRHYLNDNWKKKFNTYEDFIKGITLAAVQLSNIDDEYYTSIVIPYEMQESLSDGKRSLKDRFNVTLDTIVITPPQIVRNHNTNQFEVLFQDAANRLILADWSGNILWKEQIAEYIKTEVHQVDYYKNEKLQYLFAGKNRIFIVDRNGDPVDDYPIKIGKDEIAYLSLIDYDNSRNYRFLVADRLGTLYMTDKHGNLLDGWTSKELEGPLTIAPFHVRIRARDYIVAVQQRGVIHVMNRRGEYLSGFPIDLKDRILGDVYIKRGTNAENSTISTVTESGELIEITFEGNLVTKEYLYRPSRESRFYLVPEVQENGFIIIREGLNRVSVLDEKGNRKFEKDYLTLDPLSIQYYNFGTNREVFAITDDEQDFTYLYNEDGDLVSNQPLNSSNSVAILYYSSTKTFHIFKTFDNSLMALTF